MSTVVDKSLNDRFRQVKRDGIDRTLVLGLSGSDRQLLWKVRETPLAVYVMKREEWKDTDKSSDMLESQYVQQIEGKYVFFKVLRTDRFQALLRLCGTVIGRTTHRIRGNLFFVEPVK